MPRRILSLASMMIQLNEIEPKMGEVIEWGKNFLVTGQAHKDFPQNESVSIFTTFWVIILLRQLPCLQDMSLLNRIFHLHISSVIRFWEYCSKKYASMEDIRHQVWGRTIYSAWNVCQSQRRGQTLMGEMLITVNEKVFCQGLSLPVEERGRGRSRSL